MPEYSLHRGLWPQNVSQVAKYGVRMVDGEWKVTVHYDLGEGLMYLAVEGSETDIVDRVNQIKQTCAGQSGAVFYVNEYHHLIIPVAHDGKWRYFYGGRVNPDFTFKFEGKDQTGRLVGRFKGSGLRPHFTPKAEYFGLDRALLEAVSAERGGRFGLPPKVAFLSHSNYGSFNRPSARKMRQARDLFVAMAPDIECDGEIQGDAALSSDIRATALIGSNLTGEANILICPNLDAANILFNVFQMTGGHGVTNGPILLGAAGTAHVLTHSATVRRVVNMTALAVADVNAAR